MKSKITTALLALATATGYCDDAVIQPSAVLPTDLTLSTKVVAKDRSFGYVRLGMSDNDAIHTFETIPGMGVGYRYAMHQSAVDVSANYTSQIVGSSINDTYYYTVPKATYLRYLSADTAAESLYAGVGMAFGGLKRTAEDSFLGLIPHATVGYEMHRDQAIRSFVELDVSQPSARIARDAISFRNLPGPLAQVSVGLGY